MLHLLPIVIDYTCVSNFHKSKISESFYQILSYYNAVCFDVLIAMLLYTEAEIKIVAHDRITYLHRISGDVFRGE